MKREDIENLTRTELLDIARQLNIRGRSLMSKKHLLREIQEAERRSSGGKSKPKLPGGAKPGASVTQATRTKHKRAQRRLMPPAREPRNRTESASRTVPAPEAPSAPAVLAPALKHSDVGKLPAQYGITHLVLMGIDPTHVYAYWELRPVDLGRVQALGVGDLVLRLYDVTDVYFDGANAWRSDDHFVGYANNWYLHTGIANRSLLAEIGWLLADGRFYPVTRSNTVHTPANQPSDRSDAEWMVVHEAFEQLYALSGGFVGGLPSGPSSLTWQQELVKIRLGGPKPVSSLSFAGGLSSARLLRKTV